MVKMPGIAVIPPGYQLCLIKPKVSQCFSRSKMLLLERMSQVNDSRYAEDPALLDHEVTDYDSFH